MKEKHSPIFNQRCILMARAEAETASASPDLGEEIYIVWVETMDVTNSNNVDLNDWVDVLNVKYQISLVSVYALFEAIRLIIEYDELIDTFD